MPNDVRGDLAREGAVERPTEEECGAEWHCGCLGCANLWRLYAEQAERERDAAREGVVQILSLLSADLPPSRLLPEIGRVAGAALRADGA